MLLSTTATAPSRAAAAATARAADGVDVRKRFVMKPERGDPQFREVWRRFQLRVHPDLFARFPTLQAANEEGLKRLQGVLNEAKTRERTVEEVPKPRVEELTFYMRTADDTAFLRVPITLRLPGGDCRHVVAEAMSKLFKAAGLPTRFHWGAEYWGSTYVLPAGSTAGEGMDDDDDGPGASGGDDDRGNGPRYRAGRNRREGMA